jgi:hypothetical protein
MIDREHKPPVPVVRQARTALAFDQLRGSLPPCLLYRAGTNDGGIIIEADIH